MTEYMKGYNNGKTDREKGKRMDLPCAIPTTREFVGYFHGYGGHEPIEPVSSEVQEEMIKSIEIVK